MSRHPSARLIKLPGLDSDLKRLEIRLQALAERAPTNIRPLLKSASQSGGKRLRGALVLAIGSSNKDSAVRLAAAVELAHLASIVHDDILDKAATRRGRATVAVERGLDRALLLGDYLLAQSCAEAGQVSAQAGQMLAEAIIAMCEGQAREQASLYNAQRSIDDYLKAIHGKTAELFKAAAQLGGLAASAKTVQLNALADFGQAFGMSFQLLDDLLDILSTEQLLGKPVNADFASGVYTYPLLLAKQTEPIKRWLKQPRKLPTRARLTKELMVNGAIDRTLKKINVYNQAAETAAKKLKPEPQARALAELPPAYTRYSLAKCQVKLKLL